MASSASWTGSAVAVGLAVGDDRRRCPACGRRAGCAARSRRGWRSGSCRTSGPASDRGATRAMRSWPYSTPWPASTRDASKMPSTGRRRPGGRRAGRRGRAGRRRGRGAGRHVVAGHEDADRRGGRDEPGAGVRGSPDRGWCRRGSRRCRQLGRAAAVTRGRCAGLEPVDRGMALPVAARPARSQASAGAVARRSRTRQPSSRDLDLVDAAAPAARRAPARGRSTRRAIPRVPALAGSRRSSSDLVSGGRLVRRVRGGSRRRAAIAGGRRRAGGGADRQDPAAPCGAHRRC